MIIWLRSTLCYVPCQCPDLTPVFSCKYEGTLWFSSLLFFASSGDHRCRWPINFLRLHETKHDEIGNGRGGASFHASAWNGLVIDNGDRQSSYKRREEIQSVPSYLQEKTAVKSGCWHGTWRSVERSHIHTSFLFFLCLLSIWFHHVTACYQLCHYFAQSNVVSCKQLRYVSVC